MIASLTAFDNKAETSATRVSPISQAHMIMRLVCYGLLCFESVQGLQVA